MKSRIVLSVLAVIGIFALSVTAVQAGSGEGVPAKLNTFFECQAISGANVNQVVSTCVAGSNCDPGDGLIHDTVNIGNSVLLCRQVDVRSPLAPPLVDGSAGFLDPTPSEEIKCYSAFRPGRKGSATNQRLVDVFIDEFASVSEQPGYLCAPVNRP